MSQEQAQTQRPAFLEGQFYSAEAQNSSAKLGTWLFLGQELMFFGGLLIAYFAFRFLYPQAFASVQQTLCVTGGTIQTLVLLTASLTIFLALRAIQSDKVNILRLLLFTTLILSVALLVMRYMQLSEMAEGGVFSNTIFASGANKALAANAHIVYALFFVLTGLHSVHILIGLFFLVWIYRRAGKGHFSLAYHTPIETVGLFWHMGTFVWIFLFPLLYLAR